jgi:hypothetical protein
VAKFAGVVNELGSAICKLVGLDPNEVSSIDLHLSIGQPAIIEITSFAKFEDIPEIKSYLNKYEITRISEPIEVSTHGN